MSVTLGTYALITIDEARSFLLEDDTADIGTKLDLIKRLINGISVAAETYCARKILARDFANEDYDGNGSDTLQLKNYPINSIDSIYLDTDRNFGATTLIASTDLIIYAEEGKVRRKGITIMIDEETGKIIRTSCFSAGRKNVRVNYNAGYVTVPEDIKFAVLEEIVWHYDLLVKKKLGVTGVSAMGENTSVFVGDLLPTTKMILSSYRRALI